MKPRLTWEAHVYEYKERSTDWFWAVAIISVALALTAAIFGNFIIGILIVVASFTLALFINREPETVEVVIDDEGVTRGNLHYPYDSLRAFWIDHLHSHPRIYLCSKKIYLPLILVPLGNTDPEEVAQMLAQHLEEEHHTPPFVERFLEHLGF